MDYIGSKEKLNEWIFRRIPFPAGTVFLDGCCGSGSVSQFAASKGFRVIANDLLTFPKFIAEGSIGEIDLKASDAHLSRMNKLPPVEGFFYKTYTKAANPPRLYFTTKNAAKIDACRMYLDTVEEDQKSYLMYCLLEAVSRVSNTAGTHGAFLKDIKPRAADAIEVRHERRFSHPLCSIEAHTSDILDLLPRGEQVLYLDPPYNHRQYAPNYHLYETLVRYDNPQVKGKTALRDYSDQKSDFCVEKVALDFTRQVIQKTSAELVLISYSSDGTMPFSALEEMLCDFMPDGEISVHVKRQKRYKADNDRENDDSLLREYLFEVWRSGSIM